MTHGASTTGRSRNDGRQDARLDLAMPLPGTARPRLVLEVHRTGFRYEGDVDPSAPGGIATVYRHLVADKVHTLQVVGDVAAALDRGRHCLVLTQWTAHVDAFADALRSKGFHPVVLRGGMGAKARRAALARLVPTGEAPLLVVATGPYVGEGFDCPALDTLFRAAPIAFKGRLIQYAGACPALVVRARDTLSSASGLRSRCTRRCRGLFRRRCLCPGPEGERRPVRVRRCLADHDLGRGFITSGHRASVGPRRRGNDLDALEPCSTSVARSKPTRWAGWTPGPPYSSSSTTSPAEPVSVDRDNVTARSGRDGQGWHHPVSGQHGRALGRAVARPTLVARG